MKRPICTTCHRPQSTCICQWITPVVPTAQVLILQHPLEVDHSKNTALLLHLSLSGSQVLIGEVFDETSLQAVTPNPQCTILLYPQTEHDPAPVANPTLLKDLKHVRLVVLDATWRKSRKMLHASPWLQKLPRLLLDDAPPSHYAIRKAHKPGQLSTLEATCAALAQLEGNPEKYAPVMHAFKGFVAQQQVYATRRQILK